MNAGDHGAGHVRRSPDVAAPVRSRPGPPIDPVPGVAVPDAGARAADSGSRRDVRAGAGSRIHRALVIGGGVAGLTAVMQLRRRGIAVELLEGRSRLGGRVFSFDDRRLGRVLDNGPHVMLGCYRRMRALLRWLGTEGDFERPGTLELVQRAEGGATTRLRLGRLPPALALPPALLGWRALTFGARLRAVRGAVSALRGAPSRWSLEDWLNARGQHGAPRARLWDPLCLAIMNAEPAEVSADLFLRTVRRAFSGSASSAAIWIPRRSWSAIVGDAAAAALPRAGVVLRLRTPVTGVHVSGPRITALQLGAERRELVPGEVVVFAMPWRPFARLLPDHAGEAGGFAARAIVNVYFDCGASAPLPDEGRLVALIGGRPFQFVYRAPGDEPGRFALIASAGMDLDGLGTDAVAAAARAQLARYYPGSELPVDAAFRVTKEAAATLLADPRACSFRPRPGRLAGLENALVCGDWTQTGLPSTLEGAAESAFLTVARGVAGPSRLAPAR